MMPRAHGAVFCSHALTRWSTIRQKYFWVAFHGISVNNHWSKFSNSSVQSSKFLHIIFSNNINAHTSIEFSAFLLFYFQTIIIIIGLSGRAKKIKRHSQRATFTLSSNRRNKFANYWTLAQFKMVMMQTQAITISKSHRNVSKPKR